MRRYNDAKDLAKNLEKQATKVRAEAEEAGDKAMKIYANLTSLPPFDVKSLEVEMLVIGAFAYQFKYMYLHVTKMTLNNFCVFRMMPIK